MESTQKPVDRDAAEEAAEPRRRAAANPATRRAPVARRVPVDPAGTAAAPAADANDEWPAAAAPAEPSVGAARESHSCALG